MSNNLAVRMYPEPLRTLAFGSISGTYAGIGSPFANPIRMFLLQNYTDVTITFSWDGVTDHMVLASGDHIILDVSANATQPVGAIFFQQLQRIYAKGSPTSGNVNLTVFYGIN